RSIYNLWKQVLDYFDAFLIGLTATPDQRTYAFFHENVVSEYSHEEAVADGVNVGYDVYLIETKITKNGSRIQAKEYVEKRERLSRRKRWEQLDDDVEYSAKQQDHDVVNPSQIRKIIREFKEKLPEIFPGRKEVPKTLIFAKSDSHADDIIQIVREEFGEGNAFCKKVTYKSDEDPKSVLSQFRNDYYPRIAVTVDMIATGTDVKPIECLIFMRDVKSRNYFEQMKGRGTRTLEYDDLKKVTPSARFSKTHFVIIDAVGVTRSVKTDSRPLERKKSVPLKDLLNAVMMGAGQNEDVMLSLANRLIRLEKQITEKEKEQFKKKAGGKTINQVVKELLRAFDPDKRGDPAEEKFNLEPEESPAEEQLKSAQQDLIRQAASTFTGELNNFIENVRKIHEQIIDNINIDEVEYAGWDKQAKQNAEKIVEEFKTFLQTHRDEMIALRIFYDQPYRRRELTFKMLKEVLEVLKSQKPYLMPARVWQAYEQLEKVTGRSPKNELIALVSLIRRAMEIDRVLTPYDKTVDQNFKRWIFEKHAGAAPKFNEEQMQWLRMIKDHIAASIHFEKEDLNYAPFDAHGGIGKMYELFGDEMDAIIEELNEALAV
ncbi:MAG TPA: restriction endonuclease subunit R, partial [Caldithrix abyssi]|nr:restriction endonuclease subunit R [Caldithrix abyssi]